MLIKDTSLRGEEHAQGGRWKAKSAIEVSPCYAHMHPSGASRKARADLDSRLTVENRPIQRRLTFPTP